MAEYCNINMSETLEENVSDCLNCSLLTDGIESLHQASMEQSNSDFLSTALYHFQRILKVDYVLAGHLHENGSDAIQTKLVLHKGTVVPNMEYDLNDTPCEKVVSRNTCVYPSNIIKTFPRDEFFQIHGIEGYVGAPLIDQFYNLYGVLVAMSVKPIADPDTALQVAKLFSMAISQYIIVKEK